MRTYLDNFRKTRKIGTVVIIVMVLNISVQFLEYNNQAYREGMANRVDPD